ncbi:MAG: hypothetical protein LBL52_02220 [Rickettsiales bacterium]|nr:hypothetical protein [Rickettsiales bacterium]
MGYIALFLIMIATPACAEDAALAAENRMNGVEDALSALTAKIEKAEFDTKVFKQETGALLKNLSLQMDEVKRDAATAKQRLEDEIDELKKQNDAKAAQIQTQPVTPPPSKKAKGAPRGIIALDKDRDAAPTPALEFESALALFDKRDFEAAAVAFADNIERSPEGALFYKNLFYLGLSFKNLDKKVEACRSFDAIIKSAPAADADTATLAAAEYEKLKCAKK